MSLEAVTLSEMKGSGDVESGYSNTKSDANAAKLGEIQATLQAKLQATVKSQSATPAPKPQRNLPRRKSVRWNRLCVDDDDELRAPLPCHCWWASICLILALLGLGLGLALGGVVGTDPASRALAFIPLWVLGLLVCVCHFCIARGYSDDDDHGCGFGDYDEGPGNLGCALTATFLFCIYLGASGGSVGAILAGVNSTI